MKILVTSGGTIEKIDNIRSIVNKSTGKLGASIADSFINNGARVFYICATGAIKPHGSAQIIRISSVAGLQKAVTTLLQGWDIDVIIHAMAVSDYTVESVTSKGVELSKTGKISSDHDEITVNLKQAPKIIGQLRSLAPNATIVGFKLLNNVEQKILIEAGHGLLQKNNCDFVLANDAAHIKGQAHVGYLIDKSGNYIKCDTKAAIAKAIIKATTRGKL